MYRLARRIERGRARRLSSPRAREAESRARRSATAQGSFSALSERDVVIHVAVASAGCDRPPRRGRGWTARAEIAAGIIGAEIATATAAAIQHRKSGVETLQHDLGRVFVRAALVGPFAGLQLAFNINLGTLLQILLRNLAKPLIEDHHPVPFGFFFSFSGPFVAPGFGSRDAEVGNGPPVLRPPDFGILAEVSDQNHFVYASRHRRSPLSQILWPANQLLASTPGLLKSPGTIRSGPYTFAGLTRSAIPGYPHIAFLTGLFQFCSATEAARRY